ncbi:cytochrome P450 [Dactylosporangium sp. CA-139114]|uniref:cytochrome P450 n=1 Tax=Dactylosporangium sp. CA-139114 TaxID=3239931 RepID=UPI003D98035C
MTRAGEATADRVPVPVDVADPDLYADGDPLPVWERLRREAPVHWNAFHPGGGFWVVMTHAPAVQVYRDSDTFSSERGIRLTSAPPAIDAAAGKMMIVTDPPRHGKLRRVMSSGFTPRRVAALEDTMRRVLEPLVDRVIERGSADFVSEVAAILPAVIVCHLMDVPLEEHERLTRLTSKAFGASLGPSGCPVTPVESAEANTRIFLHYAQLLQRRRVTPGDDIVSALAQGRAGGEALTDTEIIMNCNGLLLGANETTRLASAGGLLALIRHPGQWRRLREGAVDVDTAVEEILRYCSPAMHMVRVARRDAEVGGRLVRAGERVALWNPSANRDEAFFADPNTLDLARRPNRHLAFGLGSHFCIGAALARVELAVLLRVLLAKVSAAELTGPVRMMRSNFMWGVESLPVRLRPPGARKAAG